MKQKWSFIISFSIIGFLLFPFTVGAEEKKSEDSKPIDKWSWLSKGKKLGPWWLVSSKSHDPHPELLLYHIDTSFSFTDTSGNMESEAWSVTGKLTLRKAHFSSYTDYSFIRDKSTVIAFDTTAVNEVESLTELLRYDIFKWLALEGGLNRFSDSTKFFDDSYNVFGGVAVWPLNTAKLRLKLSAFYAYGEINYRNDLLEPFFIEMPRYESDAFFGQEILNWQITKMLSLTQYFDYTYAFDDADPSLIHGVPRTEETNMIRWKFSLTFNVKITPTIYIFTKYAIRHDDSPLSDAEHTIFKYYKNDTTLSVGFGLVL